jgi:hypothetical protein
MPLSAAHCFGRQPAFVVLVSAAEGKGERRRGIVRPLLTESKRTEHIQHKIAERNEKEFAISTRETINSN